MRIREQEGGGKMCVCVRKENMISYFNLKWEGDRFKPDRRNLIKKCIYISIGWYRNDLSFEILYYRNWINQEAFNFRFVESLYESEVYI